MQFSNDDRRNHWRIKSSNNYIISVFAIEEYQDVFSTMLKYTKKVIVHGHACILYVFK